MIQRKHFLLLTLFSVAASQCMGSALAHSDKEKITSAKVLALSNSVTWRRSGMRHLYDRMDAVRFGTVQTGRWSIGQYQSWTLGDLNCDHRFVLLGTDFKISDQALIGTTVDFGKGTSYYSSGVTGSETLGASLYGTYHWNNGSYVGALMKLGLLRLKSIFDQDKNQQNIPGIYMGTEYGYRWTPVKSIVIDPQVRLTYSRLEAEDMSVNQDSIRYDATENLVFALKLKGQKTFTKETQAYVVLGYYRDLLGRISGRFSQSGNYEAFTASLFDSWGRAKLGADYRLDDRISASLQAEKTFGPEYRDATHISCSAKYQF